MSSASKAAAFLRRPNVLHAATFVLLGAAPFMPAPASPAGAGDAAWTTAPPFDSGEWRIDAVEHHVQEHLGRRALILKGGLAWLPGVSITDGVLEFDVAFSGERGFMGGVWRLQSPGNHEEFYLRPHQSGHVDANQYTPVFNGLSGWQLYHGTGFGAPVTYSTDAWITVRVLFSDRSGEVYIGDMDRPALVIGELLRDPRPGPVGLTAGNFSPAAFSRVRYRDGAPPRRGEARLRPPAEPGALMRWQVSEPFPEESLVNTLVLPDEVGRDATWTRLAADRAGVVNLARAAGIQGRRNTVFARTSLHADGARTAHLDFGYSDRVRVFLNGRLLYTGDNTYRSRDYRYLGTIGLFDQVVLNLKPGNNDLRLAVSESFGGWGVTARLRPADGVRVDDGASGAR